MKRVLRQLRKQDSGAATIEMAIVAPFLIALGLGTFEFAKIYYDYHLISTGIHDAARYLARVDNPQDTTAVSNAKNLAVYGQIGGTVKRVSWWRVEDVAVPNPRLVANNFNSGTGLFDYRGESQIKIVRVATTANLAHPGLGFFGALGLTQPYRINLFHEERHIGD